jgi:hypothetical protein
MNANWKTCRCGKKMKVTNTWDDKSRLECKACGVVRIIKHVKITDIVKLKSVG